MSENPNRRYTIHFGGAMTAYVIVLFASVWILERHEIGQWPAIGLALTPLIPSLYALHAFITRVRSMDEYQRRVVGEAMMWSAGIVGFVTFAWGFIEGVADVPRVTMIWILPAIIGTYGIAQWLILRANR